VKVLFLDIDGVLNSLRSALVHKGFPFNFKDHRDRFDWIAVGLIRRVCIESGAQIVLSSTWRTQYTYDEVARELDLPIVGATPKLNGPRGLEINAWLSEHSEVESYVIVDDNADMLPEQGGRFVQTDMNEGLSFGNYAQIMRLFGERVLT
jgi:hypothetical protein